MRKHSYIKLVAKERRRNYLVSEQTIILQVFYRKSISNRNEKNEVVMNKPVCLGL